MKQMNWKTWIVPGLAACIALLFLGRSLSDPEYQKAEWKVEAFGQLPVQVGGRIKPMDTVARVNLMLFSERQSLAAKMIPNNPDGYELTATEWLMDVAMDPETAADYRIFKLIFPDDLGLTGLQREDTRHYSYRELEPYIPEIVVAFQGITAEPPQRTAYERQIVRLHNNLVRYQRLTQSFHPAGHLDDLDQFYQGFMDSIPAGMRAFHDQQAGREFDESAFNRFMGFMIQFQNMAQNADLRLVPPPSAEAFEEGDWTNIGLSMMNTIRTQMIDPYASAYARMTQTYQEGDSEAFNDTVAGLNAAFKERYADQVPRVHFEYGFNTMSPFLQSIVLYVLVFLVVCISWLIAPRELGRFAFWLILFTFLFHTFGLVARMYIQGRPPVTNLYSSAIFVGWGAVLLCLILERIYKNGIGSATGSLIGFATLIVAHNLALTSGDTLEMMRAVLDSNFWLATHVIVITIGYSAMFVAGALAIFFLIKGILSKDFSKREAKAINGMVYGIICFAALFSLVGTILGGIWADQSWGRFWGWDPKENGALLIVLIAAIILHVRWGKLATERGMMSLAIFGNVVTSWSWFGTNMLGVGLHSYGFMDKAFMALMTFWGSQAVFMALAAVPYSWWRSEFGQSMATRQQRKQKPKPASVPEPAETT